LVLEVYNNTGHHEYQPGLTSALARYTLANTTINRKGNQWAGRYKKQMLTWMQQLEIARQMPSTLFMLIMEYENNTHSLKRMWRIYHYTQ
jgi:hypothetical protein